MTGVVVDTCVLIAVERGDRTMAVLLRQPHVEMVPLDDSDARRAGLLLAATSTSDVNDALVTGRTVQASDPDDITRLAPGVRIRRV